MNYSIELFKYKETAEQSVYAELYIPFISSFFLKKKKQKKKLKYNKGSVIWVAFLYVYLAKFVKQIEHVWEKFVKKIENVS